ncbi:hypothetical protein EDC04DRAFT_2891015 [Pisolithus marmoratus]|nr:hypothetical protein EDC04DRAFT_2891015 [Pisolithus marmoratus]
MEAQFYHVGLHSAPTYLYHMGKKWSPPRRPEAQCCYKELSAHDAAEDVLSLLRDYKITDINVDFQESISTCYAGPQLLQPVSDVDPLVNAVSPLIPALGL